MTVTFLWISLIGYAAATLTFAGYLGIRRQAMALAGLIIGLVAMVPHVVSYGLACKATEAMVVASAQGALSLLALLTQLVCVVLAVRHNLPILGAFVTPMVALAVRAGAVSPATIEQPEVLRGALFPVHVFSTFLALAGFVSAFGISIAYLMQERQIRSRKPGPIAYVLPPLDIMDRLNSRLVALSVVLLGFGIITGIAFEHGKSGELWPRDPKSAGALAYWLFYFAALALRRYRGWRGRRQAWMFIAGFAMVLFVFAALSHLPPVR